MLDASFSVGLVKVIRSFLSARRFRVEIDSVYSSYREMEAGVILDNIYLSDPLRTQRTSLALYADDTAIITRIRSSRLLTRYLQEEIIALEKWCNK